jgi:hypothetical protein
MTTSKGLIAVRAALPLNSFAAIRDCLRIAAVQETHCITIIETMIARSSDPESLSALSACLGSIRTQSEHLGAAYRVFEIFAPHEHLVRLIFSHLGKVR